MFIIVTCIRFWCHIPARRFVLKHGQTDQETSACVPRKTLLLTFWSVGRSVGWLVGWLAGWSVLKWLSIVNKYYPSITFQPLWKSKLSAMEPLHVLWDRTTFYIASLWILHYRKLTTISAVNAKCIFISRDTIPLEQTYASHLKNKKNPGNEVLERFLTIF
jgi:hypothetical protein